MNKLHATRITFPFEGPKPLRDYKSELLNNGIIFSTTKKNMIVDEGRDLVHFSKDDYNLEDVILEREIHGVIISYAYTHKTLKRRPSAIVSSEDDVAEVVELNDKNVKRVSKSKK